MEQNGLASQPFRADLPGSPDLARVNDIEITRLGDVRRESTVAVSEFGEISCVRTCDQEAAKKFVMTAGRYTPSFGRRSFGEGRSGSASSFD